MASRWGITLIIHHFKRIHYLFTNKKSVQNGWLYAKVIYYLPILRCLCQSLDFNCSHCDQPLKYEIWDFFLIRWKFIVQYWIAGEKTCFKFWFLVCWAIIMSNPSFLVIWPFFKRSSCFERFCRWLWFHRNFYTSLWDRRIIGLFFVNW